MESRSRRARIRPGRWVAIVALSFVGLLFLLASFGQIRFAINNRPQLTAAQLDIPSANVWEAKPADAIFPATIDAAASGVQWERVAISAPAACDVALAPTYQGPACRAVLRATYVDQARSMAATIAIIVTPGQGSQFFQEFSQDQSSPNPALAVRVSAAPDTAAASWRNAEVTGLATQIPLSKGADDITDNYSFVVETGALDGRTAGNLPAPWAQQPGGDLRDRDGWQIPADVLSDVFSAHLSAVL
jgi:hypothetical protein